MSRLGINNKLLGMEISLPEQHSYKDFKLTALIETLTASENQLEIQTLKNEFYHRLSGKFFDRCHKIAFKLYGTFPDWEATRDDIFQDTFITACDKIQEFKLKSLWDDKECEKVLLFWLASIANRKFLKRIKAEKEEKENLDKYLHHVLSENSSGSIGKRRYEPTYDRSKFDLIWSKLNPMSREILLLCLDEEALAEDNSKHLADETIDYLINKYGVGKATLRQAKRRALILIRSCKIEN